MTPDIRPTPPGHPQVLALFAELDAWLRSVHAPVQNHIRDHAGLQHQAVDGVSLFLEQRWKTD